MNMHQNYQEHWLSRYRPHFPRFEQIPHYYGDIIRMLFLSAVVVMLAGVPFYSDSLVQDMPFIVIGAIVMVALAAFTNPWSAFVMRLNAIVSGVGAAVFETWSFWGYQSGSPVEFVLRQAPALICVFAFYFSLKTLRAMLMGKIGQEVDLNEFSNDGEAEIAKREMQTEDTVEDTAEDTPLDALGHPAALEDDMGSD